MLPSLCNIAWGCFWISRVGKQLIAFSIKPKNQYNNLIKKQCAVRALAKAKNAGALAERWLGWAQKGQR
jgi:hypothetical protein